MLKINVKKIQVGGKNTIFSRVVNLDTNLDLIVLVSVKDESFGELFLNKILDSCIDRIRCKDTYSDFSTALENINSFLSTWRVENERMKGVHSVIVIMEGNKLFFSTMGSPSAYLVNSHQDVVEVTEKDEDRKDFWFISNGEVSDKETMIFGTTRLLNYLSKWDVSDSARLDDIMNCNDNLESILKGEKISKNIGIVSLRIEKIPGTLKETKLSEIMYRGMQFLDNNITKNIYAYIKIFQKKILSQSKHSKNILFLWWMVICFVLLYTIISSFISLSWGIRDTELYKENLLKARENVRLASENINNPDMFSLYIEDGQKLAEEIQAQELFLNDVGKVLDDISVLKKQFNGIETFATTPENTLYTLQEEDTTLVKVVSVEGKVFAIHTTGIIGPIISGQQPENYNFDQLTQGDSFIDAAVQNTDIILLTANGKIVNFARNNFFSYLDVEDQPTWEESNIIASFGQNIYLLSKTRDQIFRHRKVSGKFAAGDPYLLEEDVEKTGVILGMAIDGGIYILKTDLSIVKLFVSPQYRLETITLNSLPKNYDRVDDTQKISIYTANNLNYFYMLLENRVLVFQPNTNRFQDVKSMKYLWQVEARDFDIQDFYVANDGEIFLLGDAGLYKMGFEISDDTLIVR